MEGEPFWAITISAFCCYVYSVEYGAAREGAVNSPTCIGSVVYPIMHFAQELHTGTCLIDTSTRVHTVASTSILNKQMVTAAMMAKMH